MRNTDSSFLLSGILFEESSTSLKAPHSSLNKRKDKSDEENLIHARAILAEQEGLLLEDLKRGKIVSTSSSRRVYKNSEVVKRILDVLTCTGGYTIDDVHRSTLNIQNRLESLIIGWKALEIASTIGFDKNRKEDFIRSLKTL